MNIFDPQISGSLSVSGSGQVSGDLTVLGTLYATISGTAQNAVSTSHAAIYTLTSSFHQFTSSYTTGSFTGSFEGNGGGLYNIPASGVTGLNLSQISDGSVTASLSQANGLLINTNTEITGNLTVTGRLTAQEYHTELVSASIIYESGSTKFGNSLDDIHAITGSVGISGSLEVNNLSIGGDRLVNVSVSDAGGKYYIDNVKNPILTLIKGYTYKFLFPNIGAHPFRFSTTNDGTHNGGVAYTTGVTIGSSPDYIQIEVTDTTPSTLYYFCTSHVGMGNSISVSSDILNLDADRNVVYIEPSRIATTGSNTFTGSQVVSGSLSVTGSVDITGSITLNGQPIGTGKLDETVFNSYTSSNDSRVSSIETSTGSLNSFTNSIDTTIKNKMNNDGVVSGSMQIDITGTTGYSTFSSSLATTDSNQESRLNSIETSTGSLNTFSSSANGRLNSLETASGSIRTDFNSYTSSNDSTNSTQNSRLTSLETSTGSINTFTSSASGRLSSVETSTGSINSFTSSTTNRLNSIETSTGSINTFTSSAASNISSLETASGSIRVDFNSYTSSNNSTNTTQNNRLIAIETATSSLNSFTSSIDSTIKTKLSTEGVISGSVQVDITSTTGYSTFSSSLATTDLNQENRLNSLEGKTGSYATTGSNIFQGTQTITGSLYISQDLIVAGSSSIQNISSSIVNIADNIITVNALNPSIRFGGLAVIDSGSSPQVSGSILFDSVNDQWLFVHQNQSTITSSLFLMGPETINNLGGEAYLTQNRIPKGTGIEHLNDSNITDTGTKVSINSNTEVTGTLVVTQNISSPNITAIQTATGSLNSFTSSVLTAIELTGSNLTVKGNLLVKGTTTNVNTTTLDVDNNLINLNGTGATSAGLRVKDTTGPNQVSGSLLWDATNDYWVAGQLGSEQRIVRETEFNNAVTRIGNVETSTGSLNSFTSSINTTIKSKLNTEGVISGSSQVNHNATTNYDSNQHIDHTAVSISAGSGLSGGGTIAANRTISIATGGVTNAMLANSAITIAGTSTSLGGSISAATILSGTGTVSGSAQLTSTFVQKGGDSMSGQLVIASTGTAGAATLKVNTSSAISFIHSQENFSPNMTAGQTNILVVGQAGSTKNAGYLGYNWSSSASNSNYVSLGHWGADNLLRVYGDGTVYMGTVTTGVWNGTAIGDSYISSSSNWNTAYNKRPSSLGFTSSTVTLTLGDTSTITASVPTFNQNTTGYAMSLNGYANQTIYTILDGPANGPVIKVRYDSATANRYIDIGSKDGNGVYTEGLKLYNGSTMTWLGYTVYHSGNVPTWNQNTTGTASNITAYTINQNVGTSNSPTFVDATLTGGLTVGGSLSRGTYTTASNYVTGADNIVLKGNSSGVSGIFFESEKDGTNINHPSDFGFIQFHPYGIGGSSGEANRLVIGVSNDADDMIILNPMDTNGVKVRVGAGTTEYSVYHSGNLTNLNQLTNGPGYITGNQSISISGDASGSGATSISLTVSSIQGRAFRNTGSNEGVNANSLDANGTTYVTNVDGSSTNLTGNATDGALYSQVYSSSWQHQIYGDYRTGIMYARGKNNGTWQSWKRVALSNSTTFSNVSSVSFTHNLGTANLTAQVFDSSNNMFFPSEINITSTTVTVTFAANRTGRLVVTG